MSKLASLRPEIRRVLVVEDDQDVRESIRDLLLLHASGVEVDVAEDGEAGIRLLEAHEYDVVISDYRMPGMDGLAFLAHARRLRPGAPRILVTAFPQLDVARQAIEDAAISNFLTKPIGPDSFMEAVNAAVVKRRARPPLGKAGVVSLGSLRR